MHIELLSCLCFSREKIELKFAYLTAWRFSFDEDELVAGGAPLSILSDFLAELLHKAIDIASRCDKSIDT